MRAPGRASALVAALEPRGRRQADIVAELRRVLVAGRAGPGALVPLDQIAQRFEVSHIPVREALKTLQAEGLVEHTPGSGFRVARLGLPDLLELYTVRRALEAAALGPALERAGEDDRATARVSLARQSAALASGDVAAWDAESRQFHTLLVAPSGMPRLCHMIAVASNAIGPALPMVRLPADRVRALHADHAELTALFVAGGDPEPIQALAAAHVERMAAWLTEAWPSAGGTR
ncbi:GntR family transcriptional regulator [Propioniciclava soli]|uniref:GntR family transcriptional regulator n=1 Tax=Propioniciclava soli TaxID=2775081 RepID=UPI001E551BC7